MCIISAQGVGLRQCAHDIGGKRKSDVRDNGRGRYSPNNIYNNGFLRLYLDGQRNRSRKGKSNQAHSIARALLWLH